MERISAFMDGEIQDQEAAAQLARIKGDPALRDAWDTYHLIGDAMRGDTGISSQFIGRFSAALAREATVLAPRQPVRQRQTIVRVGLSMAASIGGVALVGWLAMSNNPLMPRDEKLATAVPAASTVPAVAPVVAKPADGEVNDYLLAHQQFSPSTTMQGVASYVRTVAGREEDMR